MMSVKFRGVSQPPGKLAEAEIHFLDGDLDGMRLMGLSVWERTAGELEVRFPKGHASGSSRSLLLAQTNKHSGTQAALAAEILDGYREWARASGRASE